MNFVARDSMRNSSVAVRSVKCSNQFSLSCFVVVFYTNNNNPVYFSTLETNRQNKLTRSSKNLRLGIVTRSINLINPNCENIYGLSENYEISTGLRVVA